MNMINKLPNHNLLIRLTMLDKLNIDIIKYHRLQVHQALEPILKLICTETKKSSMMDGILTP